jgi:hypothetical protein
MGLLKIGKTLGVGTALVQGVRRRPFRRGRRVTLRTRGSSIGLR